MKPFADLDDCGARTQVKGGAKFQQLGRFCRDLGGRVSVGLEEVVLVLNNTSSSLVMNSGLY